MLGHTTGCDAAAIFWRFVDRKSYVELYAQLCASVYNKGFFGSILVAQCEFEYWIYKYKTPIASTNQTFRLHVQINIDINILINHAKQLVYLISPANIIGKMWFKTVVLMKTNIFLISSQYQLLKFNQFDNKALHRVRGL